MRKVSGSCSSEPSASVALRLCHREKQSRESGFQNMPSHPAEIATARGLLDGNRKRLNPAFVERLSRDLVDGWSISILQPITKEAEKVPAVIEACGKCGKQGVEDSGSSTTLLTCARCKVQKYCSKECQLADWKQHKKICKAPEKEPSADIIVVDVQKSLQFGEAMGWPAGMPMTMASMNMDASLGDMKAPGDSKEAGPLPDKIFIVKVQVPPSGFGSSPMGMMCYNERRNIQCQIHTQSCRDAERLDRIVRSGTIAGGMKAYFNAYLSADGKLNIVAHKPLPLQRW